MGTGATKVLFGRAGQVAMGASLLLALDEDRAPRRVQDLASELGVAATYLAKILQGLVHAGLVRGVRGPRGGIRLAVPPENVCQWDVLRAVQPMDQFERCVLKWEQCSDDQPCPLHESWAPIRREIQTILRSKSLRDFVSEAESKGLSFRAPSHPRPTGAR